jgi:hypothetical protein
MPKCPENGECFAKNTKNAIPGWIPNCMLLSSTSFKGHCPFQKKDKTVTNGKRYPYINPMLLK